MAGTGQTVQTHLSIDLVDVAFVFGVFPDPFGAFDSAVGADYIIFNLIHSVLSIELYNTYFKISDRLRLLITSILYVILKSTEKQILVYHFTHCHDCIRS